MALRATFAWLLLTSVALGQSVTLSIAGPDKAEPGDIVKLQAVASAGDASVSTAWIRPQELGDRWIQCGDTLAFAVREPGRHTFHLIGVAVVDGAPIIATASHTVVLAGSVLDPTPEPGEPTDPPPVGGHDDIRKASAAAARLLDDEPTVKRLIARLSSIQPQPLEGLRDSVRMEIERAFLERTGESRTKDWLTVWRRPVNELMNATTTEQYAAQLAAVIEGLRDSLDGSPVVEEPAPPNKRARITMHTRDGCSWCDKWRAEIKPKLLANGWEIGEVESRDRVPQFDVCVDGDCRRLVGYQSEETFNRFLADLTALLATMGS